MNYGMASIFRFSQQYVATARRVLWTLNTSTQKMCLRQGILSWIRGGALRDECKERGKGREERKRIEGKAPEINFRLRPWRGLWVLFNVCACCPAASYDNRVIMWCKCTDRQAGRATVSLGLLGVRRNWISWWRDCGCHRSDVSYIKRGVASSLLKSPVGHGYTSDVLLRRLARFHAASVLSLIIWAMLSDVKLNYLYAVISRHRPDLQPTQPQRKTKGTKTH